MFEFLDLLPLIFYTISGVIAISYQIYYGNYSKHPTKKINMICLTLVIGFGILAIASSALFWIYY